MFAKVKKLILLLTTLFFAAGISLADSHKIDSLKNILQKPTADTVRVKVLNSIANAFINEASLDSALKYALDAKKNAEAIKFNGGLATAYNTIALVYNQKGDQPEALKNYSEAFKIRKEMGDQKGIADSYVSIGIIYEDEGNYPESMKNYLLALKIYEQVLKDKRGIGRVQINMGNVYYDQGNFAEALKYYSQVLVVMEQLGDKRILEALYINIANIYFEEGADSSAIKNYKDALRIQEETGNYENAAACYNNLGNSYARAGNYTEALNNFFLAMDKWKKSGNKRDIANAYFNIGSLYKKQKNYSEAEKYLNEGLQISKEVDNKYVLKACYDDLADLMEKKGNYKKAYEYYKLSAAVKDSLLNESNSRSIEEMKAKYETEKKENEISILNKDKELLTKDNDIKAIRIEKQRAAQLYLVAGFILLAAFAMIAFRLYNQKKKAAFNQEVLEMETKLLRAQMNPHFIFNSLNSIQSLILEDKPRLACEYLVTFSRLNRAILEQTRKKSISLTQEMDTLRMYLDVEKLRSDNKFDYEIMLGDLTETDNIMIPPLLVQPFVENSIIHGINHKEDKGKIIIEFKKNTDWLHCTVEDDGVGRARSEEINKAKAKKNSSVATQLARERIAAMKLNRHRSRNKKDGRAGIQITDLTDKEGKTTGTRVEINIPLEIE